MKQSLTEERIVVQSKGKDDIVAEEERREGEYTSGVREFFNKYDNCSSFPLGMYSSKQPNFII